MRPDRLSSYDIDATLHRLAAGAVEAGRPPALTDTVPGEASRRLWCRTGSGWPGPEPDHRYYAREVRPVGFDAAGAVMWEEVPGQTEDLVLHNVAETEPVTHLLETGQVVPAEERLDGGSPPELVVLTFVAVVRELLVRVVSYSGGTYTVQPVRREAGGMVDVGDPLSGVINLGELWPEEAGYFDGPGDYDRYVRIFWTPAGWAMAENPPRMV